MLLKTYLKRHPEIKAYYVQSEDEVAMFERDSFISDDNVPLGDYKIKQVEEPPTIDELITFHL